MRLTLARAALYLLVAALVAYGVVLVGSAAFADNPHRVKRGDTAGHIAKRHGTTVKHMRRLNPKKLRNPNRIFPGQRLKVHGKAHKRKPHKRHRPRVTRCHREWPVPGRTIYTYPGHNGVDINRGSGWDDYGDPIRAVACGRVSYVGWGRGYGQAIFQRVKSGREVVYGHTSSEYVHAGERLRTGELIGRVGSTGNSTAPHLHFGFAAGGTYQNALNFLLGRGGVCGLASFNVKHLAPEQAAALDGIGLDAGAVPHTSNPWTVWWRRIALCESGMNNEPRWHVNTGNGYYGGLQFWPPTWMEYGGGRYAEWPHRATAKEQKIVAERVLYGPQGIGAWPVCGVRGLK
jgi:LysM repeat protein